MRRVSRDRKIWRCAIWVAVLLSVPLARGQEPSTPASTSTSTSTPAAAPTPSPALSPALSRSSPLQPQEQSQPPHRSNLSGLQIFDAALAKFETDRKTLQQWQYHQTLTTQQFDRAGKVVAKGTWHSIVRPGDQRPLEYTGKSVQGKLSFFEAGAEEAKQTAATAAAKTQNNPGSSTPATGTTAGTSTSKGRSTNKSSSSKNQAEWAVEAVRKYHLRDRYIWSRLPDGIVGGEEAYVIAFTPKPKQNTSTREERFFGHLAGRMWISRRDFTVLRAQGALQSPSSLFWILARVTVFQFTYKLDAVPGVNHLFRPSHATATTEVTFPFYKVRQKHWQSVDKYEPRTARGR